MAFDAMSHVERERAVKAVGRQPAQPAAAPTLRHKRLSRRVSVTRLTPSSHKRPVSPNALAILIYRHIVEAGRLTKALAARGLALPIGYLHADRKGRNSLPRDAIEPLRPVIDAKVFEFVAKHEFGRREFPQSGYNVHRLSRDVTQLLLHKASLTAREVAVAAEWAVRKGEVINQWRTRHFLSPRRHGLTRVAHADDRYCFAQPQGIFL
jgi:hypothetical protein